MRPIKKINLPLRQDIQSLISKFEFPILLVEDNAITLLELSRKYNHSILINSLLNPEFVTITSISTGKIWI